MRLRTGVVFFIAFIIIWLPEIALASGIWNYGITDIDTPNVIDDEKTTAKVDNSSNEISLPFISVPNVAAFAPDGSLSYTVLTDNGGLAFEFDGNQMVENPTKSVMVSNPIALALPDPASNMLLITESEIKHYNFDGSGMIENPALSVAGLNGVVSIGSLKEANLAALVNNQVKRYLKDGTQMQPAPVLEPLQSFSNPIGVAVTNDYDMVVLEPERTWYFGFTGSEMMEIPALSVTGLSNAAAFAVSDDGTQLAVVDENQIKHYSFDGTQMVYNSALSVSGGISKPTAVAFRTGSYDRLMIDGNEVKYFNYDGSGMVYNPDLSKTVSNLVEGDSYQPSAVAQSRGKDPGVNADRVRVRANLDLPNGTATTWSVTADGSNWVTKWRARGTEDGTILEVTADNGITWQEIGDVSQAGTSVDRSELWAAVTPGRSVAWRAELTTTDKKQTPKIIAILNKAVIWEGNAKPNPPTMDAVPGWFYTTTPTFSWTFSDPDAGDTQTAYQVVIKRQSDNAVVYDSGKVIGSSNSFTLPTSYDPSIDGPLYQSGEYSFTVEIRTWDSKDMAGDFSTPQPFNVLAFERPRIAEIVNPPAGQSEPVLSDPSTHIMVLPGMLRSSLPKSKAGARVTILLDSVGPVNTVASDIASIYYAGGMVTIGESSVLNSLGSATNRWAIPFWTDSSLDNVPSGTLVKMDVSGVGAVGGTSDFNIPPFADGIFVTEGSVFEDWFIVLQGSDQ